MLDAGEENLGTTLSCSAPDGSRRFGRRQFLKVLANLRFFAIFVFYVPPIMQEAPSRMKHSRLKTIAAKTLANNQRLIQAVNLCGNLL